MPQDTEQQFSNNNSIVQFTDVLTQELPKHQDLIIMVAAFNFKQQVNILTHNLGHTLDLIITPATQKGYLITGLYISDHRFITLETTHTKPKPKQQKRIV